MWTYWELETRLIIRMDGMVSTVCSGMAEVHLLEYMGTWCFSFLTDGITGVIILGKAIIMRYMSMVIGSRW